MSTLLVDTSSEMQVLESNPADAFTSGQPLPEPAAATVDNDEEMLESTGGDVETAQGDDDMDTADTGMRFGTAQISKKRTAGSEGFHQLAVKQLEGRDELCSVDVLQELGAPVRDNDGDAMHCNHTFLFCCSVSSLKKMAACNRCVNPSPLKMACGSTFIAMSDVNITSILEQGALLMPKDAVDVSSLLDSGEQLARDLLDVFNNYTLTRAGLNKATDGSNMAALPDVVATAPVSRPMEPEEASAAVMSVDTMTSSEVVAPEPSCLTTPLMQVDVSPEAAAETSSEITTEIVNGGISLVLTEMEFETKKPHVSELFRAESKLPEEETLVTPEMNVETEVETKILTTPEMNVETEVETKILTTPEMNVEPEVETKILTTPEMNVEPEVETKILITPELLKYITAATSKKMAFTASEKPATTAVLESDTSSAVDPEEEEEGMTTQDNIQEVLGTVEAVEAEVESSQAPANNPLTQSPKEATTKLSLFGNHELPDASNYHELILSVTDDSPDDLRAPETKASPSAAETDVSAATIAVVETVESERTEPVRRERTSRLVVIECGVEPTSEFTTTEETSGLMSLQMDQIVPATSGDWGVESVNAVDKIAAQVDTPDTSACVAETAVATPTMETQMASAVVADIVSGIFVPIKKETEPIVLAVDEETESVLHEGEEGISDMEASTVDGVSGTNRPTNSDTLLKEFTSEVKKMKKKGRSSTKQVPKHIAKQPSKAAQRQTRKRKNNTTDVAPTSMSSETNLERSTMSTDAGDDVEMETESQEQEAMKPGSKKVGDTPVALKNNKNMHKRRGTDGITAVPSKTQKKALSQHSHAGRAGADIEDDAEAVACLPLESIKSLLQQVAGCKSNDKPKVDSLCVLQKQAEVLEDYSFVISQCDVNKNQNTYFICQVLQTSAKEAYVWYRCGRMGRTSSKSLMGPMTPHIAAIVEFTRMYQNKTGYNWFWSSENERRRPKVGSYGELDIDYSQSKFVTTDSTTRGYLETAFEYIRSIVSSGQDVITAEGHMTLLGRLSMAQVLKGYNLLEDLEQIVNKTRMKARLRVLSSLYYATIPHDFGKERMSIIESKAKIEAERKFLLTNFVLPVLS